MIVLFHEAIYFAAIGGCSLSASVTMHHTVDILQKEQSRNRVQASEVYLPYM